MVPPAVSLNTTESPVMVERFTAVDATELPQAAAEGVPGFTHVACTETNCEEAELLFKTVMVADPGPEDSPESVDDIGALPKVAPVVVRNDTEHVAVPLFVEHDDREAMSVIVELALIVPAGNVKNVDVADAFAATEIPVVVA